MTNQPVRSLEDIRARTLSFPMSRRDALRRAAFVGLSSPLLAGLLAACGSSGSNSTATSGGGSAATSASGSASTSTSSSAAKQGGSLTIGLNLEPDNLDPAVTPFAVSHTVMMNIYDTLVWRGDDGKFYPGLAQKWDATADGKTYTFQLRNDVKFHDGTDFNADAVKFTLDHIVDPASHSGFAANLLGPYDHTEVVDAQNAKVVFTDSFAPFLDGASQAFLGVVSPTAVQKDPKAFLRQPIGSGFMKFEEWVEKDHITLARNDDYKWGPSFFDHTGPAYLDKVIFRFYTDNPTRLAALQSGDAQDIESVPYNSLQKIESDSKYTVQKSINPGIPEILMLDTTKAPTDDLAVRQAVNYATDRPYIAKVGYFDQTKPSFGPLWEGTPDYSKDMGSYYAHDPAKAKSILDQAGWKPGSDGIRTKDGQRCTITWAQTPFSDPFAELIQAEWKDIGVEVQLQKTTSAAAFEAIAASSVNTATIGWVSSDPVILSNLFLSKNIKGGYSWTKYSDPKLDDVLNQGEHTTDPQARATAYAEAQKIIMDQALIVSIVGILKNVAIESKYKGLKLDFRQYQWLYDVNVS